MKRLTIQSLAFIFSFAVIIVGLLVSFKVNPRMGVGITIIGVAAVYFFAMLSSYDSKK